MKQTDEIDPLMSADSWKDFIAFGLQEFEEVVRTGLRNLYQKRGHMAGDDPNPDWRDELVALISVHDRNVAVLMNPDAQPGDQARANQELLRERKLMLRLVEREDHEPVPA